MAQNLDPNSYGRGVLQFKTGLMSVIKVLLKLKFFLVHTKRYKIILIQEFHWIIKLLLYCICTVSCH